MNYKVNLPIRELPNIGISKKASQNANKLLKRGIWAYFLLIIFEGALRKWFLPSLATPLLIIRDPIAIWLIYISYRRGLVASNIYLNGILLIGLVSIYTAIFIGHGNFFVALYGARILLFHFPLIFVIGKVFSRKDIIKVGKVTLYIAIPMVILITLQFYSPQSAWVNRGLGGDMAGGGFSGTGDFFRPPATFSFTNGTSLFFGWLAPFVFFFWLNSREINRLVLIGASIAMLAAIPFSISRTLLFEVVLSLIFTVIATIRKPEYVSKMILAMIIGLVSIAVLSQTNSFNIATSAFTDRFDTANEVEGGLVKGVLGDRFLGGLLSALNGSSEQPFFGYGIGMGTNVGSMLLTGGQTFLIAEGEWGRLIGELGFLMGFAVILLRMGLVFKLTAACYQKMVIGNLLPWLLLSFGFINLAQGGWSQPTSLGFSIMASGVILASLRDE